jgi:hypothetical protein
LNNFLKSIDDVLTQRAEEYGKDDIPERIAIRWSQTLGMEITPKMVSLLMMDLKLARLSANPRHEDSLRDLVGYAVLADKYTNLTPEENIKNDHSLKNPKQRILEHLAPFAYDIEDMEKTINHTDFKNFVTHYMLNYKTDSLANMETVMITLLIASIYSSITYDPQFRFAVGELLTHACQTIKDDENITQVAILEKTYLRFGLFSVVFLNKVKEIATEIGLKFYIEYQGVK